MKKTIVAPLHASDTEEMYVRIISFATVQLKIQWLLHRTLHRCWKSR